VRALLWAIALFAAATGLVLFARANTGYVLLASHGTRVELSLNLALLLLALVVAACVLLLRAGTLALRLPARARAFREQRQLEAARHDAQSFPDGRAREFPKQGRLEAGRALFDEALRAFFEGRHGRAERAAAAAGRSGVLPGLSAVIAARAAHELRAFSRRDAYLAAGDGDAGDRYLCQITQAELLLAERRHHDALAVLGRLGHRHTAALRLELEATRQSRNWDRVLALLPQLQSKQVFDELTTARLWRSATAEALRAAAVDADSLKRAWERVGQELRRDALLARTAARCFLAVGDAGAARRIVEEAIEAGWDSSLAALYAECVGDEPRALLQKAEGWLNQQPSDAGLLLTLGRLCACAELWGKARNYLEASAAVEPSHSVYLELAALAAREGRDAEVARHREAALQLALAQLRESTGGRRRELF
jgi:HemY protein